MARYVDGFVVPVHKDRVEEYRVFSEKAGQVWKDHGAIDYVECIADDVKPGKLTSFPQAVDLQPDEVVVFAWITYASREERDRVMDKVMKDERLSHSADTMPFDGKRMIFGGFKTFVEM